MKLSSHIAFITAHYGLEGGLRILKESGFDAVDHSLEGMIKDDSPFVNDGWREYAENIRRVADSVGIEINQTHAPFSFGKRFQNEDDLKNIVMPRIERALEISAIFGAKISVVHPWHYIGSETQEETFEKNMKFYRELIPYAKEYGVKVAVENMWRIDPIRKCIIHDTCSRADEFVRYIDTLDSEHIVACLDTGHVGLIYREDTVADMVRALGHDRLQCLHVHDNDFCADRHMLPYTGKIDWTSFTKALGEIDYQGDFTYEQGGAFLGTMDDEFLPTGIKFMEQVGRHLISLVDRNRP